MTVVTFDEVRDLIADIVELDPSTISPQLHFIDDLGVDSLMSLEILASLEKNYNIKLSEDELKKMTTLNGVISVLESADVKVTDCVAGGH